MRAGRLAIVLASSLAAAAVHAQAASPASAPAVRWTAAQIREAFQQADVNRDGQLTRAEAQHLPLMPRSFEDTDQNKDGVLTLDEYLASFSG